MNILDVFIALLIVITIFRGREVGFVRQFLSTIGFVGGLYIGAMLQHTTVTWAHTPFARSLITLLTTLGCAFLFLSLGEYFGIVLKRKMLHNHVNPFDNILGAGMAIVSFLLVVWLSANIVSSLPYTSAQQLVDNSAVVSYLNRNLPSAPGVIAGLGRLIDPNGFPDVFAGTEPSPTEGVQQPALRQFQTAIANNAASVVKVEGEGCGGIVEGSGFVVRRGTVATNAHVVAGISRIHVEDSNGDHTAVPIWFDPNLDLAVLSVSGLAGQPLNLNDGAQPRGTPAAVLGYPGGGGFRARSAAILAGFTATGRNIYGKGLVSRDIYEVQADVIPGNSGGPLIATNGDVIGIIFAESTDYKHIGYALTMQKAVQEINAALVQDQVRSTGGCAE